MTITAPRLARLDLAEVNRAFQDLAAASQAEARSVALGEWRLLEVLASEAAPGFSFVGTRRRYSVPGAGQATTTKVRLFSTGETIVRHALGRAPKGYVVLGQEQVGSAFRLDVANAALINPTLDPGEYIAFRASASGLYTIAVVG